MILWQIIAAFLPTPITLINCLIITPNAIIRNWKICKSPQKKLLDFRLYFTSLCITITLYIHCCIIITTYTPLFPSPTKIFFKRPQSTTRSRVLLLLFRLGLQVYFWVSHGSSFYVTFIIWINKRVSIDVETKHTISTFILSRFFKTKTDVGISSQIIRYSADRTRIALF